MPSLNLGRVSIVPKGAWSSSTTYEKLDVVTYEGSSYIAKNNTFLTTSITDSDYWQLFAEKGKPGTSGEWGLITGDISDQYDLQEILNSKPNINSIYTTTEVDNLLSVKVNSNDLGDFAFQDDAPEDDKEYVRKNGEWAEKEEIAWGSIIGDIEDQTDLVEAFDDKADVILCTESGDIVSFPDGSPHPVNNLAVAVEPVQDLHGQESPYPAGGGINKFTTDGYVLGAPSNTSFGYENKRTFTSGTYVKGISVNNYYSTGNVADLTVSEGTVKMTCNSSAYGMAFVLDTLTVGETYTVSCKKTEGRIGLMFYAEDGTFISGQVSSNSSYTATVPENTVYSLLMIRPENSNVESTFTEFQLESGSSATPFAPYSNVCPIEGHTSATVTRSGKNVISFSGRTKYTGGTLQPSSTIDLTTPMYFDGIAGSGYLSDTGVVSDLVIGDNNSIYFNAAKSWYGIGFNIPVKPNTDYSVSYTNGPAAVFISYYTDESKYILYKSVTNGTKFTTTADTHYVILVVSGMTANNPISLSNLQIEVGSSATEYTPFVDSTSVTIDLDGICYSGILDVKNGTLTIDKGCRTFDGTETWNLYTNGGFNFRGMTDMKSGNRMDGYANYLKVITGSNVSKCSAWFGVNNNWIYVLQVADLLPELTVSAWQAYLAEHPLTVVYPLAEPQVIQLDPATLETLLGQNVVWSDAGEVTIQYRADTKLYIDNHSGGTVDAYTKAETDTKLALKANLASPALTGNPTAPTQSAGTNNTRIATTAFVQTAVGLKVDKNSVAYSESTMKATQNYVIGDLIIVETTLYKATANISSGANLTVNTNVVATTIAAENALKANSADVYTKTETDTLLEQKSDVDHNHDERYYKKPEVDVKMNRKADLKSEFAGSGSVVQFEAVNDHQITELSTEINPVQDLHGYDAPWPAGGGKNLFDSTILTEQSSWKIVILSLPVGTWTMSSSKPNTGGLPLYFRLTGDNTLSVSNNVYVEHPITVTIPEGGTAEVVFRRSEGTDVFSNYTYQVESGSSATSYAPYSNVCPISGHTEATVMRTRKNLIDPSAKSTSGTTIARWYYDEGFLLHSGVTYSLWTGDLTDTVYIDNHTTGSNIVNGHTVTYTPDTDLLAHFRVYRSSGGLANVNLQLEIGSTASSYEAYQGQSITISLGQTIYGGVVDVPNGVLRVDKACESAKWGNFSSKTSLGTCTRGYIDLSNAPVDANPSDICNVAVFRNNYASDDVHFFVNRSNTRAYVYLPNDTSNDLDVEVCYALATPIEVTLTPETLSTLLGNNILWADTGDISVSLSVPIESLAYEKTENKADVILDTASGAIASFEDGAPYPVEELTVDINPVQDLHGYDVPWPAGGGKNKLKTSELVFAEPSNVSFGTSTPRTFTLNSWCTGLTYNNAYQNNRTSDITISENLVQFVTNASTYGVNIPMIGLTIGETYTVSATMTNGKIGVGFYQQDGTYISGLATATEFVIPENTYYSVLSFQATTADTQSKFVDIQVELGSSATSYAPYENICLISGRTQTTVTRTGKVVGEWNYIINNQGRYSQTIWSNNYQSEEGSKLISLVNSLKPGTYKIGIGIQGLGNSASRDIRIKYSDNTSIYFSSAPDYTNGWKTNSIIIPEDIKDKTVTSVIAYFGQTDSIAPTSASIGPIKLTLADETPAQTDTYSGTSVTIDLGEERYGGTLDTKAGTLTIDRVMKTFSGQFTPSMQASHIAETHARIYFNGPNNGFPQGDVAKIGNILLNQGIYGNSNMTANSVKFYYGAQGVEFNILTGNNLTGVVYGTDTVDTAKAKVVAYYTAHPLEICYYLAAPQTVTLTPETLSTLLGKNNIWSDTGDARVKYRADTKLYIEKLTQPSEDDMTANANIASGKFFMVGNNLYLSTTAITTGSTIVPGTNCTRLSLADALNNLNS